MRCAWALLLCFLTAQTVHPCTTLCLVRNGAALFGRNYDFETGVGFVMTNRHGVMKTSMEGTLHWTSRYGSVTFNQWGREFPMDGMNEAGLVVAQMWLDDTVYPVDGRPALGSLEWMQYQLDNFGTVAEVLSRVEEARIAGKPLHYLVADPTGDVATIEFLQGRLVVHRGSSLSVAVLANDTYEQSTAYLQQFSGFGGSRAMPGSAYSRDRFVRGAMLMRNAMPAVGGVFDILASVAQPGLTRWSVVYDMSHREITWTSDRSGERKTLRLTGLLLDCSAPGRMLDVHSAQVGDVTDLLEAYSAERNRQLVISAYAQTSFTRSLPSRYAEADAAHAESFWCAGPRRRAAPH